MRTTLHTVEDVRAWVLRKGGKACEWRINSGPGRAAESDWNDYTDAAALPMGKPISLRVKGSTGNGVAVVIASVAIMSSNECHACGKDRSVWEQALASREKKLHDDTVEFVRYMSDENLALTRNKVGMRELEDKTRKAQKDYYDLSFDSVQKLSGFASQMDALISRAQKAENLQAVVASVNWTLNRGVNYYAMSKISKLEDIPMDLQEKVQKFFLDEAAKEFFRTLPEAGKRLADDFTRLPRDQIPPFLTAISEWMKGQGM